MGEPAASEPADADDAASLLEAGRRAFEAARASAVADEATVALHRAVERLERAVAAFRARIDAAPGDPGDGEGLSAALVLCGLARGRLGDRDAATALLREAAEAVLGTDVAPSRRRRWWRRP